MNAQRIVRALLWLAGGALLLSIPAAATTIEACGESGACTQLRQTEYQNLVAWQECDPSAPPFTQCLQIAGNPKDCTGVLSCNFAVNANHRADAEQAVLTAGQQSQGCFLCAVPNCLGGDLTYCEPHSHRCELAQEVLDGGAVIQGSSPPPPEDSGATMTFFDAASEQ
jgi:hypothetical protein